MMDSAQCGTAAPIRVLAGDKVVVEMTPCDLSKGRIACRFK
jgi:translation initiation factor IF-1